MITLESTGKLLRGILSGIAMIQSGDYRLLADIHDDIVTIEILKWSIAVKFK